MSDAQHTPWSVKPAFGGYTFNIMTAPIGGRTFRLFAGDHATKAQADLAAAAPDMLDQHEANESGLVLLRRAIAAGDPVNELLIRVDDILRDTRTAISRARNGDK